MAWSGVAETTRRISQGSAGANPSLHSYLATAIVGKWNKKEIYTFYGHDQGQRVMIGSFLIAPALIAIRG